MEHMAKVVIVKSSQENRTYIDGIEVKGTVLYERTNERDQVRPLYKVSYIDGEGKLIIKKAILTCRYELATDENFTVKVDSVISTGLEIKEILIKNKTEKFVWDEIKKRIDGEYEQLILKS